MIKIFSDSVFTNFKKFSSKTIKYFVEKSTRGKVENIRTFTSNKHNKQSQSNEKISELKNSTLNNSDYFLSSNSNSYEKNLSNDNKKNSYIKNTHNTQKKEIKKSSSNQSQDKFHSSKEKSIDNYTIEDFLKLFMNYLPVKLDKRSIIQPDQNLSCFISYTDIINKPKATSLAKQFLEDIVTYLNSGDEKIFEKSIYEENLILKLKFNLGKIIVFNKDPSSFIKYHIYFKPPEEKNADQFKQKATNTTPLFISKRLKFNINLFNINNYICLGVEPDRKVIKNTKLLSHYQNMIMENPFNQKEKNQTIKTDVITYRESSKIFLKEFNSIPLCLLSQFEFSFLPLNDKNKICLILEVKDELNEKVKKFEFSLNSLDLLTECVFFNITYGDIMKMENECQKENKSENFLDLDEHSLTNDENKFGREVEEGTNMNKEIYDMWKFISREQFNISNSNFKIIDVNNFMDGNKLI